MATSFASSYFFPTFFHYPSTPPISHETTFRDLFDIDIIITTYTFAKQVFHISIDGVHLMSPVFAGSGAFVHGGLYFVALDTADESLNLPDEDDRVQKLGVIMVKMHHGKHLGVTPMLPNAAEAEEMDGDINVFSEKALKGRGASTNQYVHRSNIDFVNGKTADATFILRYRSLECLKSLLIVERTPPPVPLEERDFDSLSLEELRQYHKNTQERARAEKAAKESHVKIKPEDDDLNPGPRKKSRPNTGSIQLELDETGNGFREVSKAGSSSARSKFIQID
ncbi:uncharacterized protein RCC_11152 [Ramularia collo-cygni]|uniref:DUF7918 domain-containing protein n=1 Tax=Ramularia collo-cygni TaxID=112498 RepID=A0A2D3VE68_9PEZI|nr:uncharacterized protein RCC_11152 [Ramularia collo-cygni]CZT25420.1 uncharacterized protein RCC_11152 [Ramularia collo-cygni]